MKSCSDNEDQKYQSKRTRLVRVTPKPLNKK